jgi:hypothetical protein
LVAVAMSPKRSAEEVVAEVRAAQRERDQRLPARAGVLHRAGAVEHDRAGAARFERGVVVERVIARSVVPPVPT